MKLDEKFSNKSVAQLLRDIACAYELNPKDDRNVIFKIIAYQKAADAIEQYPREIYDIWKDGNLQKVAGIGPGIGSGLSEYFEKGESLHFNEILKGIPKTVFLLMKVPGIGPKKAFKLVTNFGLTDNDTVLQDLKDLVRLGQVAKLEGFGTKSQELILKGIDIFRRRGHQEERMSIAHASLLADEVIEHIKSLGKKIIKIDVLGSLRRRVSTIGDIDIAVMAENKDTESIIKHFVSFPGVRSIEAAGQSKASIITQGNIKVDLRVQDPESYGSMLQYFTGSKAHNIKLREIAMKKGFSLSEHGVKISKEKIVKFKDEKSLYSFLGLELPPPELREDTNEIEKAIEGKLPVLITIDDIKGDLHIHSSYDLKPSHDYGLNTFVEIAQKAQKLNYKYIGFSEHNPKQSGLSELEIVEIMKNRKKQIDTDLKSIQMPYFIGLEVDILPNGQIALPTKAIEYVDFLIVSIHSSFSMGLEQMTSRVLQALSYPKVKIFGHPTGRLIGKREGVNMDWDKIFNFIKDHNQAVEINAGPPRLDLPDILVKDASEKNVKFVINTDAHAIKNMDWMKYGIDVARRGWLEKNDVVNTWGVEKFRNWLNL